MAYPSRPERNTQLKNGGALGQSFLSSSDWLYLYTVQYTCQHIHLIVSFPTFRSFSNGLLLLSIFSCFSESFLHWFCSICSCELPVQNRHFPANIMMPRLRITLPDNRPTHRLAGRKKIKANMEVNRPSILVENKCNSVSKQYIVRTNYCTNSGPSLGSSDIPHYLHPSPVLLTLSFIYFLSFPPTRSAIPKHPPVLLFTSLHLFIALFYLLCWTKFRTEALSKKIYILYSIVVLLWLWNERGCECGFSRWLSVSPSATTLLLNGKWYWGWWWWWWWRRWWWWYWSWQCIVVSLCISFDILILLWHTLIVIIFIWNSFRFIQCVFVYISQQTINA